MKSGYKSKKPTNPRALYKWIIKQQEDNIRMEEMKKAGIKF